MPLVNSVRTPLRCWSREKSLERRFFNSFALHLGPLVPQHTEADGDVGRIAGQTR